MSETDKIRVRGGETASTPRDEFRVVGARIPGGGSSNEDPGLGGKLSRARRGPAGATMDMTRPYKRCLVCGRIFPTRRQYLLETEPVRNNPDYPDGHMPALDDDNFYFELRNCPCGATLAEKLRSERDLSPLGQMRRSLFSDLMDGYIVRYGIDRESARRRVMDRYEPFFRAHMERQEAGPERDVEGKTPQRDEGAAEGSAFDQFTAMLSERFPGVGGDPSLDEAIWDRYGAVRALLVLDSSGFSRRTKSQGIVHFFALIQDMRNRVLPILDRHGAESHWLVADNVFAVFPDAPSAFQAALAIQRNMRIVNAGRRESDRIEVCIGLGYGKVLLIEGGDVYGDEMNLASKLGEDVAESGQILLTQRAYLAAAQALEGLDVVERRITVSGVEISYFEINVQEP